MRAWCKCDRKKDKNKDKKLSSIKLALVSKFYK